MVEGRQADCRLHVREALGVDVRQRPERADLLPEVHVGLAPISDDTHRMGNALTLNTHGRMKMR
jgi:hypothetical protein